MYCTQCGSYLPDNVRFCTECGAAVKRSEPAKSVGFGQAVKLAFTRYADFKGRSRRSEYWWFTLFNIIVSSVLTIAMAEYAWIWSLVVLIPGLAICVRRLHDVGKSGWFYLWMLLPLAGYIIVLIQFCKDSAPDNRWGPNPKA